jgi:hypothetical protein
MKPTTKQLLVFYMKKMDTLKDWAYSIGEFVYVSIAHFCLGE